MVVDREQGIISGAPVISAGRTVDGRYVVDGDSLAAVLRLMEARGDEGTPVLSEHEGEAGDLIGRLVNPRIEGDRVVADLLMLQSADDRDLLLEAAEVMPSSFGLSINSLVEPRDDGLLRPLALYSVDLAQVPAANRRGLLAADMDRPSMTPDEIKVMVEDALKAKLESYDVAIAEMRAKLEAMPEPPKPEEMASAAEPKIEEMAATLRAEFAASVATIPAKLRAEMGAKPPVPNAPTVTSGPTDWKGAVAAKLAADKTLTKSGAVRLAIREHPDLYAAARASGDLSV